MIKVANRSPESWGPLASLPDNKFNDIINTRKWSSKERIKDELKRIKKLKTYKVTFKKVWTSDQFEIQAESEWDVGSAAASFFKANSDKIGFKEQQTSMWADGYRGYDTISYVKVASNK